MLFGKGEFLPKIPEKNRKSVGWLHFVVVKAGPMVYNTETYGKKSTVKTLRGYDIYEQSK